jgi:transposase
METESMDRLHTKSVEQMFVNNLQIGYNLCPRAAEKLVEEIIDFRQGLFEGERLDGQIIRYAVACKESAAKPIKHCKLKPIRLTTHAKDDLEVYKKLGTPGLRKTLVSRLAWEAYEHDALLSQEDLADLLYVTRNTVRRIIEEYRKEGISIPTRGTIEDIGRGVSHKAKAVELLIKGYVFSEIIQRTAHSESSVKRYLETFIRVMLLKDKGMNISEIRMTLGVSERLVKEYLELYQKYNTPEYKKQLDRIRERYSKIECIKKKDGGREDE